MKKRGQVVSVDLIMAVILFVFAFALFYSFVISIQEKPSVSFQIPADYFFDGIGLGLKAYTGAEDINFLWETSYRVDASKLIQFKQLEYDTQNKIVTGNIEQPLQIKKMDFCMYFEDNLGNVIEHVGNNLISIGDGVTCGDGASNFNPKPFCPDSFTHGLKLTRPLIYDDGNHRIVRMHVLLCSVKV